MKDNIKVIEAVQKLIEAETEKDSSIAESFLSEKFVAINRSDGRQQNRDDLLKEIGDQNKPDVQRKLIETVDIVPQSQDIAVVRSLVEITIPRKFRNTHVLLNEDGHWRCISWQVTEQKESKTIVDETKLSS